MLPSKIIDYLRGLMLVFVFATFSYYLSELPQIKHLGFSPIVIGVLIGMLYGNVVPDSFAHFGKSGIVFSMKFLLRTAIIFYGFRITFQNIALVGLSGLIVSAFMVASTFIIGNILGKKVFKIDPELALLIASGSAVCGAAAVLAAESTFKAGHHKAVIAVGTVVLFGTISMFLYPALYQLGALNLDLNSYGVYIGGSIHEVAQVVVAGNSVSESAAASGVIVKMTRVMMLAPLLLISGLVLLKKKPVDGENKKPVLIPYFVLGFILVAIINSIGIIPSTIVQPINTIDTFLLTMAMCALGIQTHISRFREAGTKPILLALVLFAWLLFGGYIITKIATTYF